MNILSLARSDDARQEVKTRPVDPGSRSVMDLLQRYVREPEFKRTFSRIVASQETDQWRSLCVVSSYPGEGKTFLVCALALAYFYCLRRRVLVLDTVHQTVEESFYFRSILPDDNALEKGHRQGAALHVMSSREIKHQGSGGAEVVNLNGAANFARAVPSGFGPDVSDFLIKGFIADLEDSYDLIVLDTCALSATTAHHIDPVVLATQVDRTLVLATHDTMRDDQLSTMKERLSDPRIQPLGLVVNAKFPLGTFGGKSKKRAA